MGVAIGLLMPFVANIVPISRALSSTLRNALDVYHKTEVRLFVVDVVVCVRLSSISRSVLLFQHRRAK